MELFNKSGLLVSSLLVAVGALIACQAHEDAMPPANVIEAAALHIGPVGQSAAERRLREWAEQGSPVAQRELALRYQADPAKHGASSRWATGANWRCATRPTRPSTARPCACSSGPPAPATARPP